MPRFYFHVAGNITFYDEEGIDLRNLVAARNESTRFFGRFLSNHAAEVSDAKELRLDVANEAGEALFSLVFVIALAPMAERALRNSQAP